MPRAATSIPEEWIELLDRRVVQLRRPSESNYIACLIEDDLRAAGLLKATPDETAEVIEEVRMAIHETPAFKAEIIALLKQSRRTARAHPIPA